MTGNGARNVKARKRHFRAERCVNVPSEAWRPDTLRETGISLNPLVGATSPLFFPGIQHLDPPPNTRWQNTKALDLWICVIPQQQHPGLPEILLAVQESSLACHEARARVHWERQGKHPPCPPDPATRHRPQHSDL